MSNSSEQFSTSFVALLTSDVVSSLARWKAEETQAHGRDLIRTVFAAIEGVAWDYKEHVIGIARDLDGLKPEEETALLEHSFQVSSSGTIIKQPRFVPLLALIRLTTRIAARLSAQLEIDFGQTGWERLRVALAIRNRVTHPKRQADMVVTAADVITTMTGFYWLLESIIEAKGATNQALRAHNQMFRQLLTELESGDPMAWAEYRAVEAELRS